MSNLGQGREAAFFRIYARPTSALADVGPAHGHSAAAAADADRPALLAATAAAFAVTERLKLEKSPITGTRVDKVFSPVCECARDIAEISFRLRGGQVVTVDMLDSKGRPVRTLVRNKRERAGRVTYVWDGRDDAGRVVREGVYRPRVRLRRHGRTIVLPNPIRVDTTAPKITLTRVFPRVFSPDGDGNADRVTAEYEIDEPARAMMLVNGRRRVLSKFRETEGRLVWFGRIGGVPSGRATTRSDSVRSTARATVRSGHGRSRCGCGTSSSSPIAWRPWPEGGSPSASRRTRTCTAGSSTAGAGSTGSPSSCCALPTSRGRTCSTSSGAGPIGPKSPSPSRPSPEPGQAGGAVRPRIAITRPFSER